MEGSLYRNRLEGLYERSRRISEWIYQLLVRKDLTEPFNNSNSDLKGDTGPLVYPAGFVYLFSGLYHVTENGKNIELAQQIFALFYLVHLGVVFKLYHLISNELKMPPLYLVFMSLTGYRMHSIFALRLFNDGPAMTIFYLSIISFVYRKWRLGNYSKALYGNL